jgi:S-formylglutathione hydrolase FrmB
MRRIAALALLALLALAPAAGATELPRFADGDGVHVVSAKQIAPRLIGLTLTTPLLTAPTNVRILLPADYDAHPRQRYPVLWLWHGTSGGAQDWTSEPGRAQDITAGLPLIVVMPDAGVNSNGGSWFTDWVNGGRYGPPKWETWHIDHLLPWVDSQLRTIDDRSGRAIAGLSQGGFGAMSYAARHPEFFVAAASFSGAVDIAANPEQVVPLVDPVLIATEVGLDGVPPGTFFGPRATNSINYEAHDPATLAGNLRGMRLFAWTGNGQPGPLDSGEPDPGGQAIEAGVHQLTTLFHGELVERGIPIDYHDYGPGTHTWPYWERDLRELVGPLMRDFDARLAPPATVDYMSDAARYDQWGWHVEIKRATAREFTTLSGADAHGFALSGTGTATVRTPALYAPGRAATVTVGGAARRATVDSGGRLTVTAALPAKVTISAPPAPKACASRRTLAITVRGAVVRATAGGRRVPAARRGRRVLVRLTGLPRGRYRVVVTVRAHGATHRVRRVARTCAPARRA